jgi:hypothetical protein
MRNKKKRAVYRHKATLCLQSAVRCWHENKQDMGDFWHQYAVELNKKATQL